MLTDPHSYSEPQTAVVKHLNLNLVVDFETKLLKGFAEWEFTAKAGATQIIFDTDDLKIEKITDAKGIELKYEIASKTPVLGSKLSIFINDKIRLIKIYYSTDPTAAAVQWLTAQQTAGKKHPFLFTQSQAILARSWIPCQDSPGIRFDYEATIQIPNYLIALMSAENPQQKNNSGIYNFKMPQPIPSYLMALSVGDLEFTAFDNRCGVYAEPNILKKAAFEFEELPKMIAAAEALYGKYEWGQYDILVLPPSFPFGGMENPRLTFATPTILAGDKSLTSLVAHELAHSWSGNLVTNATWNDFWMNEGFTVYFENRIMEVLYGKDFSDMQKILGQQDLKETVQELGVNSNYTKLKLSLEGSNPDDGMNDIAYEKGNNFLLVIEEEVGRKRLDTFLKNHFKKHAFKTITTEDFLIELKRDLLNSDELLIKKINIEQWVYNTGIPNNITTIQSKKLDEVESQIKIYKQSKNPIQLVTINWSAFEWMYFLRGLPENLSHNEMSELNSVFKFGASSNNEILFLWLELSIKNNYHESDEQLNTFLMNVGRRKFVKPLYAALIKTVEGKKMATAIFAAAKNSYHSVTSNSIEELLK